MNTNNNKYALAIHGGAGVEKNKAYDKEIAHMRSALELGQKKLQNGEEAINVVTDIVVELENSGLYIAGKGTPLDKNGNAENDASIIDGKSQNCASVAVVRNVKNPIILAKLIMEKTKNTMLAGLGAEQFAKINKIEFIEDPKSYFTAKTPKTTDLSHGTVGAVALDLKGNLASATSTGGIYNKTLGRVGDTPIIGAGGWADKNVAISCTGIGEYFVRLCMAHDIASQIKYANNTLDEAMKNNIEDKLTAIKGDGGAIAVDKLGNISMRYNKYGMKMGSVSSDSEIFVAYK